MPVVIGIAGGSGSGKTTVQRRIIEAFGPHRIALLDHDSYYLDLAHLPPDERARFNFDHPAALETALMVEHLDRLLAGLDLRVVVHAVLGQVQHDAPPGSWRQHEPRR